MQNSKHVLIIGGGIAGPVAAMFLHKAGISSAVYEAREEAEAGGAALQVAPNGMYVLKALGLDHKVAEAGCVASRLQFRNSAGKVLSTMCTCDPAPDGSPAVTIMRSSLHAVLIDALRERGIPIYFGKQLIAIDDAGSARPVKAGFKDGTSAEGDIVIGADGIWSATRRLIMPDAPEPVYTGLLGIGGVAPMEALSAPMLADRELMTMTWGASGFFGYGPCRLGNTPVMLWWSNQARQAPPTREETRQESTANLMRAVREVHHDWHQPVGSLIEQTEELQCIAIYEMPSLGSWSKGRVVLIGDAAHAMATSAGQGASQALEDAMLLAKLLRDEPGPLDHAFASYETQRRPRVEKISAMARRNSDRKKTLTPFAMHVRDFLVAHVLPSLARRSWNQIYAWKVAW
jgi:2-polyprenyl-6-methoxyphenol hydroxylase-like FAD-dependent oxidoreductase